MVHNLYKIILDIAMIFKDFSLINKITNKALQIPIDFLLIKLKHNKIIDDDQNIIFIL
jgi:hypothetical protein